MTTSRPGAGGVRAQVADSWVRSAAAGVHADMVDAPITLPDDVLRDYRAAHPLARGLPAPRRRPRAGRPRLRRDDGRLRRRRPAALGLRHLRRPAAGRARSASSRAATGTSAWPAPTRPAWRCALDRPVSVIGGEHFRQSVQRWSCAATPIHDPTTHRRCSASSTSPAATHIVVPRDDGDGARRGPDGRGRARPRHLAARLDPRRDARSRPAGPSWSSRRSAATRRCSPSTTARGTATPSGSAPRHSEILLLLAGAPRALSGDELAVLLYRGRTARPRPCAPSSTGSAACSASELLASRPYRLAAERHRGLARRRGPPRRGRRPSGAARLPRARSCPRPGAPGVAPAARASVEASAPAGGPAPRASPT